MLLFCSISKVCEKKRRKKNEQEFSSLFPLRIIIVRTMALFLDPNSLTLHCNFEISSKCHSLLTFYSCMHPNHALCFVYVGYFRYSEICILLVHNKRKFSHDHLHKLVIEMNNKQMKRGRKKAT